MDASDLQKRREALGLSRDELARELSTTGVTVWRWENAERAIPPYLELAIRQIEQEKKAATAPAAKKAAKKPASKPTKKAKR